MTTEYKATILTTRPSYSSKYTCTKLTVLWLQFRLCLLSNGGHKFCPHLHVGITGCALVIDHHGHHCYRLACHCWTVILIEQKAMAWDTAVMSNCISTTLTRMMIKLLKHGRQWQSGVSFKSLHIALLLFPVV